MSIRKKLSIISNYIQAAVIAIIIIFVALLILFLSVGNFEWDFEAPVDATIVNGILTADAIIFGFISFELRRIDMKLQLAVPIALPLIFFFAWSVTYYFTDGVKLGYPTVNTLIITTITFFVTIFYYGFMLFLTKTHTSDGTR